MVYILYGHFVLLDINKNRFLPSRLVLTTGIMGTEKSPLLRIGEWEDLSPIYVAILRETYGKLMVDYVILG